MNKDDIYVLEFNEYKLVLSDGTVLYADKDKGQYFDYDTIKKIFNDTVVKDNPSEDRCL